MMKVLAFLAVVVVVVLAAGGGRWYMYVNNTTSPYDEVGIELNTRVPEPMRAWGCGQLHANFPKALPPYGCSRPESGKDWIQ